MTTSIETGAASPPERSGFCAACGTSLSVGARFCHRCGTPYGMGAPLDPGATPSNGWSLASVLPWAVAGIALVTVVVILASRTPDAASGESLAAQSLATGGPMTGAAPFAGGAAGAAAAGGAPPDIGSMTPSERAARLYVRIMQYADAGKTDSVTRFAPMALAAHQMLQQPTPDERYHFGRVAEVVGVGDIAAAQADTILRDNPRSLLGLVLAARAARTADDAPAAKAFDKRLLDALASERATGNIDYDNHRGEIDRAVADARRPE